MEKTSKAVPGTRAVSVGDRECDFYDFFAAVEKSGSEVLVRASKTRIINKDSQDAEKGIEKLWGHIASEPEAGSYSIDICEVKQTKNCKGRTSRTAELGIKFGKFTMPPPINNPKHKTEVLSDIQLYAIYAFEKNPPVGEEAVEWMLLTNQPIETFDDACERVYWYRLRWRIDMYLKVLKSGFRVEECRLGTADYIIRYLTAMSIVAWRILTITLIARTNPTLPCSQCLSEDEWKALVIKSTKSLPATTPTIAEALVWIARLGGYRARKNDGQPGNLVLWRGWTQLMDLTEGYRWASQF